MVKLLPASALMKKEEWNRAVRSSLHREALLLLSTVE
jgi:hypothetical protein